MVYVIIRNDMKLMHIDKKQYVFDINELAEIFDEWGIDFNMKEEFMFGIFDRYLVINPNTLMTNELASEISHWSFNDYKTVEKLIKPFSRENSIDILLYGYGTEEDTNN